MLRVLWPGDSAHHGDDDARREQPDDEPVRCVPGRGRCVGVTHNDSSAASGGIKPDARGRYHVCPSCRSPQVIAWPDDDDDGRWKVEYECGSVRPDDDPEGDYSVQACEVIDDMRRRIERDLKQAIKRADEVAALRAELETTIGERDDAYGLIVAREGEIDTLATERDEYRACLEAVRVHCLYSEDGTGWGDIEARIRKALDEHGE
jgi:hypothetical protein